ncbi:hypothetical protein KIN20_011453 [Parelaphostrongylus tenuis]|uniref:Uncharacterized protein n=1 Tax=Parelaphostrongylus tenuis TaxID=148309 RepID=A0AAD5MTM5_PARTN|nr:hypothetical protein KIN20_011453 [Parelaphostrongylus tenuis]
MLNVKQNCIIIGDTVTGICNVMQAGRRGCKGRNKVEAISFNYKSISGTVTTTNIIMANWSKAMWQNVVNRAVRMLAFGPFRPHFFSAIASVEGS